MKWGLSEEELETAIEFSGFAAAHSFYEATRKGVEAGVQATFRHVHEEGEKPCVDLTHYEDDPSFRMVPEPKWRKRFDCLKCREELKQEAGC